MSYLKVNRLAYILPFMISICIVGCHAPKKERPQTSNIGFALQGWHNIHQISSDKSESGSYSANYFLFFGSSSGQMSSQTTVSFSWLGNDGDYRYSTLPLSKIRVELDEKAMSPIVKFRWTTYRSDCDANSLDSCIIYAIIRVNSKQWPAKITMPLK